MPVSVIAQNGSAVSVPLASELPSGAGLATTTTPGLVKQAAAVADAVAAPTQAEYNALLAALRAAGVLAP